MKRTRTQKIAMIIAIVLAALLILPILVQAAALLIPDASAAVSQKDIDKRKNDAKVYQEQKAKLKQELKNLKAEKADALKIKISLDEQIRVLELEIDNNNLLMQDINLRLAEQQQALETALEAEARAEELFAVRIRFLEEAGGVSYLGVLFESASFSDFLTRFDMVSEMLEADRRALDNLLAARQSVEDAKAQLEQDKNDLEQFSKELTASQAELAEQYAEADALIAELNSDTVELEKAYAEAEKADKEALDEIAKLQAELKKQQEAAKKSTKYVGGEYLWPLPGYDRISSGFGWRNHPILKVKKLHKGIDIPAPKGTKIIAANDGVVLTSTYNSSYGNYVCVDHGGGKATLYAHMSKSAVKKGQTVKKGDVLGYVGSTGMSTGYHLHFECIENGKQVQPLNYFKEK